MGRRVTEERSVSESKYSRCYHCGHKQTRLPLGLPLWMFEMETCTHTHSQRYISNQSEANMNISMLKCCATTNLSDGALKYFFFSEDDCTAVKRRLSFPSAVILYLA